MHKKIKINFLNQKQKSLICLMSLFQHTPIVICSRKCLNVLFPYVSDVIYGLMQSKSQPLSISA